MKEKDFQRKFSRWASYNLKQTTVCELKLARGSRLPFQALQEHQKVALSLASTGCIGHKLSDEGLSSKPADHLTICYSESYVVVMFYKRGQKEFFMIPIGSWIAEEQLSKEKSLTEFRAREIGRRCLLQ